MKEAGTTEAGGRRALGQSTYDHIGLTITVGDRNYDFRNHIEQMSYLSSKIVKVRELIRNYYLKKNTDSVWGDEEIYYEKHENDNIHAHLTITVPKRHQMFGYGGILERIASKFHREIGRKGLPHRICCRAEWIKEYEVWHKYITKDQGLNKYFQPVGLPHAPTGATSLSWE